MAENIVDDSKLKNPDDSTTLEFAGDLVGHKGNSLEDWRTRSLGLQLTLLGLAEVNAKRIESLSKVVTDLEEKVFDAGNIKDQSPSQLMGLYKMSTESLERSIGYVKQALTGTNWEKLESDLITIQARKITKMSVDGSRDQSDLAREIVERLKSLKLDAKPVEVKLNEVEPTKG